MRSLIIACLILLASGSAFAQHTDSFPYMKHKELPAFEVLALNGDTSFNTFHIPKGKPSVLMLFSPDCDHCEQQVKLILGQMGQLENVNFYLMTPMSLEAARKFADRMDLASYPNIRVFEDNRFFFNKFYGARYVPDFAIYDKNKRFVRLEEGKLDIPALARLAKS